MDARRLRLADLAAEIKFARASRSRPDDTLWLYAEITEQLVTAFQSVSDGIAEVATTVEVMLHKLASMQGDWPRPGAVDKHGNMDGNNPHVWFPVNRPWEGQEPRRAQRFDDVPNEPSVYVSETTGRRIVTVCDSMCPCGLWHTVWLERNRRLEERAERVWRSSDPDDQSTIRVMFSGLTERDVQ